MERKGCCCQGNRGQQADRVRSVTLRCQTNLVLSVRSDILPGGEKERQRSVASGKWPCSRLLLMFWPGGASRPIARPRRQAEPRAVLRCLARAKHRGLLLVHVGRSLATSCWCSLGRARSEAGLGCLRPSESRRVGWSGCKAGESSQGAGGTVPILGAWGVVRRLRLAATECKCRLCEAWAGCVCFSFEERSDEVVMPALAR